MLSSGYRAWIPPVRVPIRKGTLCIQITVSNGPDSTFNFTITPSAAGITDVTITTVNGIGSITIDEIDAGCYNITEIIPSGWALTSPNAVSANVCIGSFDTIFFINNNNPVPLMIIANTNPPLSNWIFNYLVSPGDQTGSVTTGTGGTGSITFHVPPNTIHTISEIVPSGWAPIDSQIINSGAFGDSIIFENQQLGILTINKFTDPPTCLTFNFNISPPALTNKTLENIECSLEVNTISITTSEIDGDGTISISVLPGSYTITEINIPEEWEPMMNTITENIIAGNETIVSFHNTLPLI